MKSEEERMKAICEIAGVKEIDDLSDGFHTFRQLYYQRMMLFATIVKQNKDKAWKSLRHEDGELCFGGGWFIVGIDTPEGSYTYHYEDNFYSLFDCIELERAKHWDGHTEKDVTRLLSLEQEPCDDIEEIREVMSCDADAETKCKMISNILTAKPHYFKEQKPCDDEGRNIICDFDMQPHIEPDNCGNYVVMQSTTGSQQQKLFQKTPIQSKIKGIM